MTQGLNLLAVPGQESVKTSRSKLSIVASIRCRASRLLHRRATDDETLKTSSWGWFHGRFYRNDSPTGDTNSSPRGSDGTVEELESAVDMVNMRWSSSEASSSKSPSQQSPRSHVRVRLSKARDYMLHSFPGRRFRRNVKPETEPDAPSSSPASSIYSDKEGSPVLAFSPPYPATSNRSGSFRCGVQRAVQDAVDDSFHFSEDYGRSTHDRSSRPPLRTLWTIMSADSTEEPEPTSPILPSPPPLPARSHHHDRPHTSLGFAWDVPSPSPPMSNPDQDSFSPVASKPLSVLQEVQNKPVKKQNISLAVPVAVGPKPGEMAGRWSENRPASSLGTTALGNV